MLAVCADAEAFNEWRNRFLGFASGQHSSEETLRRWRAFGNTASNLNGLGMKPSPPTPLALSLAITPITLLWILLFINIFSFQFCCKTSQKVCKKNITNFVLTLMC